MRGFGLLLSTALILSDIRTAQASSTILPLSLLLEPDSVEHWEFQKIVKLQADSSSPGYIDLSGLDIADPMAGGLPNMQNTKLEFVLVEVPPSCKNIHNCNMPEQLGIGKLSASAANNPRAHATLCCSYDARRHGLCEQSDFGQLIVDSAILKEKAKGQIDSLDIPKVGSLQLTPSHPKIPLPTLEGKSQVSKTYSLWIANCNPHGRMLHINGEVELVTGTSVSSSKNSGGTSGPHESEVPTVLEENSGNDGEHFKFHSSTGNHTGHSTFFDLDADPQPARWEPIWLIAILGMICIIITIQSFAFNREYSALPTWETLTPFGGSDDENQRRSILDVEGGSLARGGASIRRIFRKGKRRQRTHRPQFRLKGKGAMGDGLVKDISESSEEEYKNSAEDEPLTEMNRPSFSLSRGL